MKMNSVWRIVSFQIVVTMMVLMIPIWTSVVMESGAAAGEPDRSLKEAADGLRINAEDMVAHGGMGDAKAILHHCGESSRYAESLLKQVPVSSPRRDEAIASLNDVVKYCKRVTEIGIHADPGVLLNPAVKARAAAHAALKTFGLTK